jgi:hypothetical protein
MNDQPATDTRRLSPSSQTGSTGGDSLDKLYIEVFAVPVREAKYPDVLPIAADALEQVPARAAAVDGDLRARYLRATRIPINVTETKIGGLTPGEDYYFVLFFRNRNAHAGQLVTSVPIGVDI